MKNFCFFLLAGFSVSCAMEPNVDVLPKPFNKRKNIFEDSFEGKSLDLTLANATRYCINYKSQDCVVLNVTDNAKFEGKACFVQTSADTDYFALEFICDEKKDGKSEACTQTNAGSASPQQLNRLGRLSTTNEPSPDSSSFEGVVLEKQDISDITVLSVVDSSTFCDSL